MADTAQQPLSAGALSPPNSRLSRSQQLNQLYALPAPLRTFPLPTLVPHNPLSFFHMICVWVSQSISPQPSHFSPLYEGTWSPDSRSIHVVDNRSIRGLWEQGFFGKGTLSRSEPNWMKGQMSRANKSKATSEDITKQRREERQQIKWERARKEREAIDQKLLEEAGAVHKVSMQPNGSSGSIEEQAPQGNGSITTISDTNSRTWARSLKYFPSPVGPLELLSLPNSAADLEKWAYDDIPYSLATLGSISSPRSEDDLRSALNGHQRDNLHPEDGTLPNGNSGQSSVATTGLNIDIHNSITNVLVHSEDVKLVSLDDLSNGTVLVSGDSDTPPRSKSKGQKSVRFSPTVEKNTFIQTEPPSPDLSAGPPPAPISIEIREEQTIQEQEHFQLMMEEAFFLSYALGALSIVDPVNHFPISNEKLLNLFRKSSHFPPQANPVLAPDDSFLINYVVYHHYRSLGWCVRGGAKFSCDFMLYNRGPVFSHAEFAILIMPSYTDPYWSADPFIQNYVRGQEKRRWSWMHCINRVISQVKKKLILVYVDIPSPLDAAVERELRIDELLGRYRIREYVMKRWLSNRERG